ncbi:MAG: L-seryl-tRNA(Sec) selenium transferase [Negativicutes bacterium]|nr:L-seryl-tRNA(Sec) selenium transferase [Negativicutes bacterium]
MAATSFPPDKYELVRERLRRLPAVDRVQLAWADQATGQRLDTDTIRQVLAGRRRQILAGEDADCSLAAILDDCRSALADGRCDELQPVINATGVVLHTNLGRAPLARRALAGLQTVAAGYSNLEYDLKSGERGSRYDHVTAKLCRLTGAEAALVVNNNAAAVLLAIAALVGSGEVIVSRGELVEIGGGFRVPQVIARLGGQLREVGTTNRTGIEDYRQAIGEQTRAILKVHCSNFRITGFTSLPDDRQLVDLASAHGLPAIYDIGSGYLRGGAYLPAGEKSVAEAVAAGYDLVTFSGDKLLGGPQAGIIVGKRSWVERLYGDQLLRALRIDKLSLAALAGTLDEYLDDSGGAAIPAQQMLGADPAGLRRRAGRLAKNINRTATVTAAVVPASSQAGGGALPELAIASWAVAVRHPQLTADELRNRLRRYRPPIIVRVEGGAVLIDVRCLLAGDDQKVVAALTEIGKGG